MFHAEKSDIPLMDSIFKMMEEIVNYRADEVKP